MSVNSVFAFSVELWLMTTCSTSWVVSMKNSTWTSLWLCVLALESVQCKFYIFAMMLFLYSCALAWLFRCGQLHWICGILSFCYDLKLSFHYSFLLLLTYHFFNKNSSESCLHSIIINPCPQKVHDLKKKTNTEETPAATATKGTMLGWKGMLSPC